MAFWKWESPLLLFLEQNFHTNILTYSTHHTFHLWCKNLLEHFDFVFEPQSSPPSALVTQVCTRYVFNVICKVHRTAKDLKPWFKVTYFCYNCIKAE